MPIDVKVVINVCNFVNEYITKDENSKLHKSRLTDDFRHYCNNVLNCKMPTTDKDDCYIFDLFKFHLRWFDEVLLF